MRASTITNTLITTNANVYNGSPNFVNTDAYDFKLNPTSPAKGMGDSSIPLNYPILIPDIIGTTRSGSISAGAYQ